MVEEHCRAGSAARDEGCPNIGLCSTGCTYRYDLWSALAPSQRRKERGSNPHENPRALPIGSPGTLPHFSYDGPQLGERMVLVGPRDRDHVYAPRRA